MQTQKPSLLTHQVLLEGKQRNLTSGAVFLDLSLKGHLNQINPDFLNLKFWESNLKIRSGNQISRLAIKSGNHSKFKNCCYRKTLLSHLFKRQGTAGHYWHWTWERRDIRKKRKAMSRPGPRKSLATCLQERSRKLFPEKRRSLEKPWVIVS